MEDALESNFLLGSRYAKIIRTNNEILSKSRYNQKTVSPRKNQHLHGPSEIKFDPNLAKRNINIRNLKRVATDHIDPVAELNLINSREEIQPFLPFLNHKRRRDVMSNTKRYEDTQTMFKTADISNNGSYAIEERTDPTVASIQENKQYKIKRVYRDTVGLNQQYLNSSASDCSKFFDDFTKMKSERTFEGFPHKEGRTINLSAVRMDPGYLTHKPSLSFTPSKHHNISFESREIKQALDRIDDMLLMGNFKFQPNKTLISLNEAKWKDMEQELKSNNLPRDQQILMQHQVMYNKAVIELLKGFKNSFPDVSNTIFRLVEGFNSVIDQYTSQLQKLNVKPPKSERQLLLELEDLKLK